MQLPMELEMKPISAGWLGEGFYHYGLLGIVILIAPIVIFIVWFKTHRITRIMDTLPGPPAKPIIGNLGGFLKAYFTDGGNLGVWKHAMEIVKVYRKFKIMRLWASWRPVVALFTAGVAEAALTSQEALDKAYPYRFLHSWLGTGLLTSTGNKWRTRRRLLTPTFHFRILEDFVHVFNEQSMVLVEKLKQYVDGPAMDVLPFVKNCALDIICETTMGVQTGAQTDQCLEYVRAIQDACETVLKRYYKPWLWSDLLFFLQPLGRRYKANLNIFHSFTKQVVREKKKQLLSQQQRKDGHEENGNVYIGRKKRQTFLDLLLHYHLEDASLSEDDINEEVNTFMFEGHDTTATGIGWALYNIGLYPDIQKKVQEELQVIFGDDTERSATPDDLKEMKYLECVLKESQRLYPSVPIIGRELHTDLEIPSVGVTLPKGVQVAVPIYYIHRDESIYPNPEKFDPDRFLAENSQNRHPFAFIPFSAGPRNCIGQKFAMMEEKVVVSSILRNFAIRSVDPADTMYSIPELVLHPCNGIRIELKQRLAD